MRSLAIVAGTLLVLLGGYSLLGGGFSWTDHETVMDMGPVHATAETRESLTVPPLAAGGLILVGVGLAVWGVVRKA